MIELYTNEGMRASDEYTIKNFTDGATLMSRAGIALASEIQKEMTKNTQVLFVCGGGNNGGDGYVAAEILRKGGGYVRVFETTTNFSTDCERERKKYLGEFSKEICGDIIVDCIFGTGLTRDIEGKYAEIINKINNCKNAKIISCDIPSGLCGNSGNVLGVAVKANKTVAIGGAKVGFYLNDGLDYTGEIIVKNIGICMVCEHFSLVDDKFVVGVFPKRQRNSHKGNYGAATIVGGFSFPGAAVMSLYGALYGGCGYVKFYCNEKTREQLYPTLPDVIYDTKIDLNSNAIAFGMGCGVSEEVYNALSGLLQNYDGTLIIDADGLNSLSFYGVDVLKETRANVILTPHIKEFSRLCGAKVDEILSTPIKYARDFANKYGVTVILKSGSAIITNGKEVLISASGNSSLSRGGSGDVLAGLICAISARGVGAVEATASAHYILGRAAKKASEKKSEYCTRFIDVISEIGKVILEVQK